MARSKPAPARQLETGAASTVRAVTAAEPAEHAVDGVPASSPRELDSVPAASAPLSRLTSREREVAWLVERGRTNRQIASALRLSERTVESHLANVYRKLGTPTRAALAAVLGAESARGTAP